MMNYPTTNLPDEVDDEFELQGHERTRIPDEGLWEVSIRAGDGSTYEVNATLLRPAPR